jgi:hypothetical protein
LFFGQLWTHNIGHALWDGLYAAWVAAVRMGHGEADGVLRLLVDQSDQQDEESEDKRLTFDYILQKFSGEGRYLRRREMLKMDGWHRFESVIVGSGGKGQRWMNKHLRLPGWEDGAVRLFRDRMYRVYGMDGARPWREGRARREVNAIIVDNKRYTDKERDAMDKLVQAATAHGYNLKYVDWGNVGEKPNNFGAHLEVLRNTDIYISGPGTGMMYAPFLPDQAVFVALGALNERNGARWVTYMEEYVCEGTPFIRALYYPSRLRTGGVRLQMLAGLFDTAVDITVEGFEEPPEPGSNLSVEGQIFRRTCAAAPDDCQYMLDAMNSLRDNTWLCLLDGWVDYAVYEVGRYNETQPVAEDGKKHAECMNAGFREALRKEVKAENERSHALARPCVNAENCNPLLQYHVGDMRR